MQGSVKELAETKYGSVLLLSCIERASPSALRFITEELKGSACSLARLPEQYQLICQLIQTLPSDETQSLVEELLGEFPALSRHPKGNHVVQHLLQYAGESHRTQMCSMVADDLLNLCRHRVASHVVEQAAEALEGGALIAQAALKEEGVLVSLACNRQSQFVAQRLLKRPDAEGESVRQVLAVNMDQLKDSKYGSRIAEPLATYLSAAATAA